MTIFKNALNYTRDSGIAPTAHRLKLQISKNQLGSAIIIAL